MSKAVIDSNFPVQTEGSVPTQKHLSKLEVLVSCFVPKYYEHVTPAADIQCAKMSV